MKIDIVCFSGGSGLGDYTVSLARSLSKSLVDCNVRVLSNREVPDELKLEIKNFRQIFRKTRHLPIDYFVFLFDVLANKTDIVIFQSWIKVPIIDSFIVSIFRAFGIKCICTVHDVAPHSPKLWSNIDIPLFFRGFDGLVVHSTNAQKRLQRLQCRANTAVIPHGVYDIFDLNSLSQIDSRRKFPELDDSDLVVLFFGNIEERKGIVPFIESFQFLSDNDRIKYLIAGKCVNEKLKSKIDAMVASEGRILNKIEFIPFSEVQYYFSASDIVVLPYYEGTTSGVLKLAIAFKKPVVCTDIGDARETVFMSPPLGPIGEIMQDGCLPEEIARSILFVESNLNVYKTAIAKLHEFYSWDVVASKYIQFINEFKKVRR